MAEVAAALSVVTGKRFEATYIPEEEGRLVGDFSELGRVLKVLGLTGR